MRPEGWLFMVIGWSVILALFLFSMSRTLRTKDNRREDNGEK